MVKRTRILSYSPKLLSAFVWNALVGPDDIVVTLNYDTEKSEPVQLEIKRVRTDLTWLPG